MANTPANFAVSNWATRALVRGAIRVSGWGESFASRLKTAALWPNHTDKGPYVYWSARVKYPDRISFGEGLRVGPRCVLGALGGIEFGDHCRLSQGVIVETGGLDFAKPAPYLHISKPIKIGSGVWIGANAVVLGGVTIGDNAIIGAGAVVSRDVGANTIYVGAPGRVLHRETNEN